MFRQARSFLLPFWQVQQRAARNVFGDEGVSMQVVPVQLRQVQAKERTALQWQEHFSK